jgi:hypothetical protein
MDEMISEVKQPDIKTHIGVDDFSAHDMNAVFVKQPVPPH